MSAREKTTMLQHMRRHPVPYLLLVAVWVLVCLRVFVDLKPRVPVMYNGTHSLPFTIAVVRYGVTTFTRGDYIVYAFDGSAKQVFPGLKGQPFFKRIVGVPGDHVTVQGREVFVNGTSVGVAKQFAPKRMQLEPIEEVVIPPGYYYVAGTDKDSFDSRYRQSGLVREGQILSAVVPIF